MRGAIKKEYQFLYPEPLSLYLHIAIVARATVRVGNSRIKFPNNSFLFINSRGLHAHSHILSLCQALSPFFVCLRHELSSFARMS
jgi:hypothetical protein